MAKKEKIKFQKKIQGKQELKYHLIFCSIIFILTFTVYFNSLKNGFVYDDEGTIVKNYFIKDIGNIKNIFSNEYFRSSGELTYRPVCTLTYFIDYHFYKLNPFGYHLTNILFHILNSILVYFLALTIFKRKYILSLFTSLLFGLHPITTEPVNGIGFREDLIAVCFFLISWLFYIKYSNTNKLYFFLLSLISFIISLFSKESTVVLPLVLILYTFSFESSKRILKRKYSLLTYFIVLLFYIYLTRYSILSNPNPVIVNYPGNSIHTTFFTMTKVFANYVRLLIIPINLRPDYVVHISHSLFESEVIISIIILTLCILAGILIYRYNKVVFFAIFYFFITLIPVSQIIPFGILMAERFLYISLLSFCIIITILLDKLLKNYKLTLFIPLLGCYSILTFNQNKIWKNEIILWKTTLERTPNSPMGYNNLGVVYERKGQLDKAEEYFKKAIEYKKDFAKAYINLGVIYREKGLLDKAEKYLKKAIELDKNSPLAYNNLGVVYERKGQLDKAEEYFKKAIELDKNFVLAYNNLGLVYGKKGQLNKAEEYFKKAIKLDKNYIEAYNNLGIVYEIEGNLNKAEKCYKRVIELKGNKINNSGGVKEE